MYRCLQLAANGRGFAAPNPMVGAVIVHNDRIIGEGYHRICGGPHAEVNAVASVKDPYLLAQSTLYVNLEPCSHYGKTPPCAQLIIDKHIPRVVVGMTDPYPEVSGRGIEMLRVAGVDVQIGILEEECLELNRRFVVNQTRHRPYIVLKWAQSADGFVDIHRQANDGQLPVKFSDEYTRALVHKLRAEANAILIGRGTEVLDRPRLDVRYWDGPAPLRLVADSGKSLKAHLQELYEAKQQSLIVEGGSRLLRSFIREGLWDEARVEVSHLRLGEGVEAPAVLGTLQSVQKCKKSEIFTFQNEDKP